MMHKKTYEIVARSIKEMINERKNINHKRFIVILAKEFESDNPKFNLSKFKRCVYER